VLSDALRVCDRVDDEYIRELAVAVAGKLGGKIGVAPRIFLKKLVADVLDRVDQFSDFDPRQHYALTFVDGEMTRAEVAASRDLSTILSLISDEPNPYE
jgi:hypothetical protein